MSAIDPSDPLAFGSGLDRKAHVDRQKHGIVTALEEGRSDLAERYAHDLARAQDASGRPDLASKSLCDLAKRAERMGELELAERWLEAALDRTPDDPIIWAQLVTLMRVQGRSDARLAWSQRMVERFPASDVALSTRASTLRAAGRLEEALDLYDRALREMPSNVHARNGRAALYRRLGRFDDALAAYEDTRARFPDDEFAWNGLGGVLRAQGELARASALFEEVRARFPTSVLAHLRNAEALVALGELSAALAVHDEGVRRFPTDFSLSRGRARNLVALARDREALLEADRVARRFPRQALYRAARAEVLKEIGELDQACRIFLSVFRHGQLDSLGRVGLCFTAIRLGDFELASQAYSAPVWELQRMPLSSSEWSLLSARGLLALAQGAHEVAEAIFTRCTASAFVDHRARGHHMLVLSALMQRAHARASTLLQGLPPIEARAIRTAREVLGALARWDGVMLHRAVASSELSLWPLRLLRRVPRKAVLAPRDVDRAPDDVRAALVELVHL